ncbi:MAG: NADH-quinone oxidoreductase subunit N [bacterium]
MPSNITEYYHIIPFLLIAAGIVISLIIEMASKKSVLYLPWLSVLLFVAVGSLSIINVSNNFTLFGGMLEVGGRPAFFNFIFNFGAAIVVLSSIGYLKKYGAYFGEYYILVQSAVLGMMVMAGSKNILMIFLGLELMSICFYVLAGINRKKILANEASMKYFLLGAFATGFIVYGIALIYGSAQTISIDRIISNFGSLSSNLLFVTGFLLFLIGFSFKIAAFPFHMWVPDVYQGSATTVTGLMSTTGKAAAFSVLLIMMTAVLGEKVPNKFMEYFAVIAVLSMLYGSIVAIAQDNLKRMLAYSSISHAGYMAIGLAAGNLSAGAGIMFYLAAYIFMNLGAFGIIAMLEGEDDSNLDLNSYAGLNSRNPVLAGFMALFMFALAGIPPLAGFFGKYYVFVAAVDAHLTWLAIVGVLSSVINVYFYIRVVVYMYFKDPLNEEKIVISPAGLFAVSLSAFLVILFGLMPGTLLDLISSFLV